MFSPVRTRRIVWGAAALTALLLAVFLPVAAAVPQSRREFIAAVTAGARGAAVEKFTVDRGVDSIYALLRKKSVACLDVEVRRSGNVGGTMEVTSSDYNPTTTMTAGRKLEFSLQVVHRPRAIGENAPPGGLYIMAADVRPLGGGRSEVVLYRPTIGFKKIVGAVRQWTSGEDADCPKVRY